MKIPLAFLITGCLILVACASKPNLQGNERGGMINWFATNESEVFAAANAHCARYGKVARITSLLKEAGGHVLFDCN